MRYLGNQIRCRALLVAGAIAVATPSLADVVPLEVRPDAPGSVPEEVADGGFEIAVVRQLKRGRRLPGVDLWRRRRGRSAWH